MAKVKQEVEIEEREPQQQPQPQQQQPRGKICYGDCFSCSLQQAVYCASTHARVTMRIMEQQAQTISEMWEDINTMKQFISTMIDRIAGKGDEFINPLEASDGEQ